MISLDKDWKAKASPKQATKSEGARIEATVDLRCLESLKSEWVALFERIEGPSACASYDWIASWWEAFGQAAEGAGKETHLFVLSIRNPSGELVGIVPLYEELPADWTQMRRLRLIGDLGHDGVFGMTEEPTLLIAQGWDEFVLDAVAQELRQGVESGRWDFVTFRVLRDGETCPLRKAFGHLSSKTWLKTDQRSGSDYAELPTDWAEYRKSLSKSMRDNLGYYPRLLTRDGHDWEVRYVRDSCDVAEAATRLTELHRARATSQRGLHHCNHLAGTPHENFLSTLLSRLAEQDKAFIAELVVDGEVIASQAFIENKGELTVFYSGYLDGWYKYSPIFVIDTVVFRDAMERGVRRLDFLRNSSQWKTRWGTQPGAPLRRATLVAKRPVAALRYAIYFGEQLVRRNLTERMPVIQHRVDRRLRTAMASLTARFGQATRALLPLAPVVSRHATRMAPSLHLAVRLMPLHHH